jgi:ABC-type antimicrobial peptide transport system permease subunit
MALCTVSTGLNNSSWKGFLMIHWNFVLAEFSRRRRRTSVSLSLIAFSIGVLIVVNAAGASFQKAFRTPLEDMGATLTVQRAGDVPEKMEGPVFPCAVAPIYRNEVREISRLPGVQSLSQALLIWDFEPKEFRIILGLDPADKSGPARLKKALVSGRFLAKGDRERAVIDQSFARNANLAVGQTVNIQGKDFEIVGTLDSSRLSQVATAQVYVTLPDARALAVNSPGVKALYKFGEHDANLLFLQADRDKSEALGKRIKEIMGEKATVSAPASFEQMLGGVFALTDRFSWMISVLALVVAFLLVARTTASNVRERRAEIGTMKAVGWTQMDIVKQIGTETLITVILGGIAGILLGFVAAEALSHVTIAIPIPWEMAPRPHFLPGGSDQLTREVRLSVSISPLLLLSALFASLVIGVGSAWAMARSIANLKPAEVLRYE